jgi:hypothetical protein
MSPSDTCLCEKVICGRPRGLRVNTVAGQALVFSIARYAACAMPMSLGAGRFAPKCLAGPIARSQGYSMMSRLPVPQRESSPLHVSGSAVRHMRRVGHSGRHSRSRSARRIVKNAMLAAVARYCRLRQNAAAMLLEARLMAVRYLPLAAIGCVNSYFHWDFPKFNIS